MSTIDDGVFCGKCQTVKPASMFSRNRSRSNGLSVYCKLCEAARVKKYNQKNPQQWKAYQKANAERIAEYHRKRWAQGKDRYKKNLVYDPEKAYKYRRRWTLRYPAKHIAQVQRYRARKIGAKGSYTAEEWHSLCEQYNDQCLACGKHDSLTVDHVIPLSKGGSNGIDNIQPLCRSCNSRKGNKSSIDYRCLT